MTSKPRKRDAPPGPGRKEQGNEAQQDAAQNRGPAFHVGCRLTPSNSTDHAESGEVGPISWE